MYNLAKVKLAYKDWNLRSHAAKKKNLIWAFGMCFLWLMFMETKGERDLDVDLAIWNFGGSQLSHNARATVY